MPNRLYQWQKNPYLKEALPNRDCQNIHDYLREMWQLNVTKQLNLTPLGFLPVFWQTGAWQNIGIFIHLHTFQTITIQPCSPHSQAALSLVEKNTIILLNTRRISNDFDLNKGQQQDKEAAQLVLVQPKNWKEFTLLFCQIEP